jgi:hypothetical protein
MANAIITIISPRRSTRNNNEAPAITPKKAPPPPAKKRKATRLGDAPEAPQSMTTVAEAGSPALGSTSNGSGTPTTVPPPQEPKFNGAPSKQPSTSDLTETNGQNPTISGSDFPNFGGEHFRRPEEVFNCRFRLQNAYK